MTEMCLSQAGYMLETALPSFMITLKEKKKKNGLQLIKFPFFQQVSCCREALSSLGRKTQAQGERGAHARVFYLLLNKLINFSSTHSEFLIKRCFLDEKQFQAK